MDTSSAFQEIFICDSFDTFEEFEIMFEEFQLQTGSVFRVKSSSSVQTENKRIRQKYPECLKYASVTYVCVHYGQARLLGRNVRVKQSYLACGCEAKVSLCIRKNKLTFTQKYLIHNHNVSPELQQNYPKYRRLTDEEFHQVKDMVKVVAPSKLTSYIRERFSKNVTVGDICNMKRRRKKSENSDSDGEEEVMHKLKKLKTVANNEGVDPVVKDADVHAAKPSGVADSSNIVASSDQNDVPGYVISDNLTHISLVGMQAVSDIGGTITYDVEQTVQNSVAGSYVLNGEFALPDEFTSFQEFETIFKEFQRQTGSVFRIKSSSSVEWENKRRQHTLVPECLKYASVKYICVHYGQTQKKGTGKRVRQNYLPCGCEAHIALTAKKNKFYPAMPFIGAGSLLGLIIATLI